MKAFRLFCWFLLFGATHALWAGTPIVLTDTSNEYVASFQYIDILEDKSKNLTIEQVLQPENQARFVQNKVQLPRNNQTTSAYWIRVNVKNQSTQSQHWLTEFYDSSIEKIQIFIPNGKGGFIEKSSGNTFPFGEKFIQHKNFVFLFPDFEGKELTYYVRVESRQLVFMLSVIRTYQRFSFYALSEYYFLGIFYGLILAMALYNLFIYITTRDSSYLYYVLYVLSNALYSLSLDGTGFQYVWDDLPAFNRMASSITVFSMVIWALFYTKTFLNLSTLSPFLDKTIKIAIILRVSLFLLEIIFLPDLKNVAAIDAIPLMVSYASAIVALRKGYLPARYFVTGITMLFIGFIISNLTVNSIFGISLPNNIFTVYSFNFGTVVQLMFLSFALADRIKIMKIENDLSQERIIKQLRENDELKEKVNRELEQKVQERTAEVVNQAKKLEEQSEKIEYLYKEVKDSIETAKIIQQSILPSESAMKMFLPQLFVLYKPKDIVSGDFYWFYVKNNKIIIAAVDCTGHGVAGAFMSLIGYNLLNQIIKEKTNNTAADILNKLNEDVIRSLHQDEAGSLSREGMDVALCIIDLNNSKIQFSGANNPLYHIRKKEITVIKADKYSIGIQRGGKVATFTNQEIDFIKGDMIYLFSDGYAGQIGGEDGNQKFMLPRFRELLASISDRSIDEQYLSLDQAIEDWKKGQEQLDDILVMGIRF